ncbi:cupin domain-containing protein [Novosphingobium album (ex Liu et al. 2023)]|uniref:Cupin domain-containing protein n=1 Tax=Novosphingobium album (ex Liu et al. 2023) TaxID=3031130 RepID=A0ABT5WXA3_9SPHN|nr:cupin domain-containing protein [Novosphingobium album (ex Liu et al. 2023)]MDE8654528.1 cupin domain-containing protein [Novosphingobium album (ex Liu et al. 2023)]
MTQAEAILWTTHVDCADIPWITVAPGLEQRVLQARPDENLIVTQSRYQPHFTHGLHRHLGPIHGYTIAGAWGHEDGRYPYRPGVYLYEPAGVVHRFFNGPAVSQAMFVTFGDIELLDPATRAVIRRDDAAGQARRYLEGCEAAGVARPPILG